MKKGFTLIEVLTVIIIIGVIGLIAFPAVNSMIKQSREDLYNEQLEEIKLASEKWAYNNIDLLPSNENETVTITLLELKMGGYLPLDIRDPRTDELLPNSLSIVITYKANDYEYEIKEVITNTEITDDKHSFILSGLNSELPFVTIGVNKEYTKPTITATDNNNNDVSDDVIITYYDNGKEVAKIDTSKITTYTVEYSVTSNNITTVITQTVIIADLEYPIITVPETVTITSSEADTYDLLEGVTVTDDSNEDIKLEVSGFDTSIGEKIVSYKGCDSSGKCTTENRIIVVE